MARLRREIRSARRLVPGTAAGCRFPRGDGRPRDPWRRDRPEQCRYGRGRLVRVRYVAVNLLPHPLKPSAVLCDSHDAIQTAICVCLAAGYRDRSSNPGDADAYPPNSGFCCVRRRARRSAAGDRQGAILSSLFAVSAVLAVLRSGCHCRHRRDDRHRAVRGARGAALLLRILPAALLRAGILRAAVLLRAPLSPTLCPPLL